MVDQFFTIILLEGLMLIELSINEKSMVLTSLGVTENG